LLQRCAAFGVCLLAASAAAALDVRTSHTEGVDFASYRTWSWKTMERAADHPLAEGSALDRRIRAAVERELAEKGMSRTEESPDLWVTYDGVVMAEYGVGGVHVDYGPVAWVGYTAAEMGEAFQRGMLSLSFADGASGETVWRGFATNVDRQPSPETMARRAEKAIGRMLRDYPPR
jgi:hypothetical protein